MKNSIIKGVIIAIILVACRYIYVNTWDNLLFIFHNFLGIIVGQVSVPAVDVKVVACLVITPLICIIMMRLLVSKNSDEDGDE